MRLREVAIAIAIARWLAPRQAEAQDVRLARSERIENLMERATTRTDKLRGSGRRGSSRLAHR